MQIEVIEDETLWRPNDGGQYGFMRDYMHRYCAMAGGWYAGKTWAGARKLIDQHFYNGVADDGTRTGVDSCVIAPTYQLGETVNLPEIRKALEECGLQYKFVADPKKYWFELPELSAPSDPSLIYVRTADAPDRITGFTVGSIWGDEVARWKCDPSDPLKNPMLQAKGRLRDTRAKVLQFNMTFTHEGDATEVYRDFEENPKDGHAIYRAGTFENPSARQFAEEQRGQLTDELARQYLDGQPVSFRGGLVYGNYDAATNRDDSIVLADQLPIHLSVDFNINPGMHGIIGQYIPQADTATAIYELYRDRMDVRGMVGMLAELIGKLGGWKWPELQIFGDASGDSKWAGNASQSCWDILTSALDQLGLQYQNKPVRVCRMTGISNPEIADRVNAFNCAFKSIDGRVRYKIHPRCERLIGDFRRMKWDKGKLDKSDQTISHASDAEGYRIHKIMPIRKLAIGSGRSGMIFSH